MSSDHDDESPTRRDSGSLALFESTAAKALESLEKLGLDDTGEKLAHEARELLTVFRSWAIRPPISADRAQAIQRVMDLHLKTTEYLTRRRHTQ